MSPTPIELREIAKIVRHDVLTMTLESGSGHIGGSLSAVDLLVVLYWEILRIRPDQPRWEDRDRLVLSKAHAAPALYAALARRGYFEVTQLLTFRKLKSMLQGFPDMQKTRGIDASVGSPGQGLSIANGVAMAAKRDRKDFRVYCLMGDGEAHEGQVWEAAMTAAHHKLDNVCGLIEGYHEQGEQLWRHFHGGRDGTLGHYRAAVDVLRRGAPHPLVERLHRAVARLESLVGD